MIAQLILMFFLSVNVQIRIMEEISTGINNSTPEVGDLLPRARPVSIQILRKICNVNRTLKFHINNLSIVLHSLNHSKLAPASVA